eukprot:CAMPEP_0203885344 /NCGR_PEP_ID=MMETSP0359-20131031/29315_1 /ASSEMBLY_ACC=CAM_ASM_000338 /TAXON_ID=268821 /ORGANISM="Scrippsiella Hangoei, Strain SHTV-5" /LENGTH=49 /DNA_ID= /DNA_START= /DNA_END= /DNA_ORIENTATION=
MPNERCSPSSTKTTWLTSASAIKSVDAVVPQPLRRNARSGQAPRMAHSR